MRVWKKKNLPRFVFRLEIFSIPLLMINVGFCIDIHIHIHLAGKKEGKNPPENQQTKIHHSQQKERQRVLNEKQVNL